MVYVTVITYLCEGVCMCMRLWPCMYVCAVLFWNRELHSLLFVDFFSSHFFCFFFFFSVADVGERVLGVWCRQHAPFQAWIQTISMQIGFFLVIPLAIRTKVYDAKITINPNNQISLQCMVILVCVTLAVLNDCTERTRR